MEIKSYSDISDQELEDIWFDSTGLPIMIMSGSLGIHVQRRRITAKKDNRNVTAY